MDSELQSKSADAEPIAKTSSGSPLALHSADTAGAATERELPSIMIDPSIHVPEPPATPAALPGAVSEAAVGGPGGTIDFDAAEADRFAANFRPSWEAPAPVATAAAASAHHSPWPQKLASPLPASMPAAAAELQDEPLTLPLARSRKRAQLWVGGSVLGFLVLAYLAVASSSKAPTPHLAATPAVTAEPTPPAAVPQPAPNPAAATPPVAAAAPAVPSAPAQPLAAAAEKAPEPAAPSPTPTAIVALKAPTPPETARLRVATEPRQAALLLNGTPVSNPFDARLPLGATYQLEARAPGHEPAQRTVSLAREERISLALARTPPPTPPPRAVIARAEPRIKPAARRAPPAPPRASRPKPSKGKGAGFVADSPY